jgi:hypothetical protein
MQWPALGAVLIASAAWGQPKVFWASDPVGPDETVLVCGDGFGEAPRIELTRAGGKGVQVEALQPSDQSVKFVVPADWKLGPYAFRITGAGGVSEPTPLNRPTIYWCQGDTGSGASPGGWLRIFGRCLSLGEGAEVILTPLEGGTKPERLAAKPATLWALSVELPEGLASGHYEVSVAQKGGAVGKAPVPVTIAEPERWPDRVFNVRDLGATGEGSMADGAIVREALKQAEAAGGGVVYFPRGRYRIDGTLRVPEHIVLRGEARGLVSLFWPDTDEPYALIEGTHHFGLEDLTIHASNCTHCIAAEVGKPESGHTFLRRVRVRADLYRGHLTPEQVDTRFRAAQRLSTGGGDVVRFGGENIEITDCDLYGSGRSLSLLQARGGRVIGNTFYHGRWGWYCIDGSDGLILERNRIIGADLMSTGGSLNCYSSAYSQNVYYAENRLEKMHGWDREAMTTDAGYGAYYGTAAEIGPDRLVLAEEPNWKSKADWTGGGVFILGGKGMGQYRRIAGYDGRTVTLDRPWDVSPDGNSPITITMLQAQYLFVGNEFEDVGIALQYYGTSIDHVAAGNKCSRGGGFYNSGRWYRHFQPSWYCQFLDNEILEGNSYRFGPNNATDAGVSYLGTWGLQSQGGTAPLALCSVHRRNRLHNNAELQFVGVNAEHPGLRDVVAEHNTVENAPRGGYVDSGCVGVLLRENRFINVEQEIVTDRQIREALAKRRAALLDQQQPVAHYSFDDAEGGTVRDDSGHKFWARSTGALEFVAGVAGKAPRFDGSSYLAVADDRMLQFPRLTIAAWVLPDQLQGRWGVVAKRSRNAEAPYVLSLRNGGVGFEATDAKGVWSYNLTSQPVVKPGEWTHIAATCEEGAVVKLYCNGAPIAEKPATEALCETSDIVTIGFEGWGGADSKPESSGNFHGLIDEVKLWSRVLTAEEVAAEYGLLREQAAAATQRLAEEAAARAERAKLFATTTVADGGVAWKLVYFDDFERPEIGSEWKTLRGRWQITDGHVACREVSFLAYARPLSAPVRIEFDARSAHPGDLTAFWGTREEAYVGGYFIGFASNGNTANKILRLGQDVAMNTGPLARPNQWHHIIGQVFGGQVQLIVDGELALEYEDKEPLTKPDTAGVIAWGEGEFDNLRIYTAN